MSSSNSVWAFQNLLAIGGLGALAPIMSGVQSVSAGTGGVTVTGTASAPIINIPQPVTSITAGTNITVTGTSGVPQVNLASPLQLAAPLTLSNVAPSAATQLGFVQDVAYSGPTSFFGFTNDVPVTYFSTTVSQPGVYLVFSKVTMDTSGAYMTYVASDFAATNVSIGNQNTLTQVFNQPYNGVADDPVLPLATLVVVPPSTTSVFTVGVRCAYAPGVGLVPQVQPMFNKCQIVRIA